MNGIRIIAPSLAGVIVEVVGIGEALYLNAACFGMAVVHLWTMKKIPSHDSAAETNVLGSLRDGIGFIVRTPVVLGIISMGFAFGFFGAAYLQVLPAFARDILSLDAVGAGLLLSAAGAGSLVGNLALASL
jgi:hypothetical protein